MITSSLCLSSVVPISLYFSVVLSKFNKGLWQFRKSCEVMFENESQVVKVIINGLHDCHFLLIVVYTLYRERGIFAWEFIVVWVDAFYKQVSPWLPMRLHIDILYCWNHLQESTFNACLKLQKLFFFTTCVKCAFYMLWVGISLRRDFKFYATDPKYPQNLELFWTLTPHTFDYKYIYVHLWFFLFYDTNCLHIILSY